MLYFFFFFNDTATTEIYTLSLHDALPISPEVTQLARGHFDKPKRCGEHQEQHCNHSQQHADLQRRSNRSEEHTSELQSLAYLVCRLLLEKKKIMSAPLGAFLHMITCIQIC